MTVPPFGLRMPPGLQARVKRDAAANNRSMNAEIVARLEASDETLRDKFAGQAMAAIIERTLRASAAGHMEPQEALETTAQAAFGIADAMIAARSK